jgi:type I restriction enzyme S subunit
MCGNRAVINIRTKKKELLPLVFLFLLSKQNEFENMAVGSAQKNLYVPVLAQMGIFIPPQYNYNEFNTIFNSIYHYQRENEKLTELQSLLLAKMGNM